jgi:phosphate transport system substrate-binding protein
MFPMKNTILVAASALALSACGSGSSGGGARDHLRVVGSSTVYPFASLIAENTVKAAGIKAPVIESTGTGAGMKLFCAGVGIAHPDVEMASRRMKASEYEDCAKNGVKDVVEIQIGLDGIAFAEATERSGYGAERGRYLQGARCQPVRQAQHGQELE